MPFSGLIRTKIEEFSHQSVRILEYTEYESTHLLVHSTCIILKVENQLISISSINTFISVYLGLVQLNCSALFYGLLEEIIVFNTTKSKIQISSTKSLNWNDG